jgi:hypothetical protein
LYLSQEFLQQERGIVLLPDHVEWQPDIHINNWQQDNAAGAMPAGGFSEPRDPDLALDTTQHRIAICRLLNNMWSDQASASARLHHLVIEGWIDPAMEPDKRHVAQIAQANSLSLRQRMAFRHGKRHPVQRELPMLQLLVPWRDSQPAMWVTATQLPTSASHPCYRRLHELLREHGFDDFVEGQCASFYAETMGRPGLPPGIYFRLPLIGYFEGIDSERGIAWRAADPRQRLRSWTFQFGVPVHAPGRIALLMSSRHLASDPPSAIDRQCGVYRDLTSRASPAEPRAGTVRPSTAVVAVLSRACAC